MSAAIKNALTNLDKAIDRVEGSVIKRIKSPKSTGQADLFSAPANVVGFDRSALTRKLDITIARVEQLLSEG